MIRWSPHPQWEGVILKGRAAHSKVWVRSALSCAETGLPILTIYIYGYDVFPRKDVTFGSVVENAAHLGGQI